MFFLKQVGLSAVLVTLIFPSLGWSSERLERLERLGTELSALPAPENSSEREVDAIVTPATKKDPEKSALVQACDRAAAHPWHPDVRAGRTTAPGLHFDEIDTTDAVSVCRSAHLGFPEHARSAANLGRALLASGNFPESLTAFRHAASMNDPFAQHSLGNAFSDGNGVPKNDAKAAIWFRKAAEQGNPYAQNTLGLMYARGEGVPMNDVEAVKWYLEAAEQGLSVAQNNVGYKYLHGEGVARNLSEAVYWFSKAAKQGNASAQNRLGLMYKLGKGVPVNEIEAVRWYRKSADQGNAKAQNNLGIMYEFGMGVDPNPMRAADLYFSALEAGDDWLIDQTEWTHETARAFQRRLHAAGLYDGAIDGLIGAGTKSAMRKLIASRH